MRKIADMLYVPHKGSLRRETARTGSGNSNAAQSAPTRQSGAQDYFTRKVQRRSELFDRFPNMSSALVAPFFTRRLPAPVSSARPVLLAY